MNDNGTKSYIYIVIIFYFVFEYVSVHHIWREKYEARMIDFFWMYI